MVGRFGTCAEVFEVIHSDADWRKLLTPDQYVVLRQSDTERPFTSALLHEERRGTFVCAGCDAICSPRPRNLTAYGWPSFWARWKVRSHDKGHVVGMVRTAVIAAVAEAPWSRLRRWPKADGLRYCMNGVALKFKPATA